MYYSQFQSKTSATTRLSLINKRLTKCKIVKYYAMFYFLQIAYPISDYCPSRNKNIHQFNVWLLSWENNSLLNIKFESFYLLICRKFTLFYNKINKYQSAIFIDHNLLINVKLTEYNVYNVSALRYHCH